MKVHAHGDQGSEPQTQVRILIPINFRQYLSCAARGHGIVEGRRRQCPYFHHRVGPACAAVTQQAQGHAQVTAGGAEKVSL